MNKTTLISALSVVMLCATVTMANGKSTDGGDRRFENVMLDSGPRPVFVIDGGPMMPPPHGFNRWPGRFGGEPFGGKIKLTDKQRDKIKVLDKNLKKDMKRLRDDEDDLREKYRERFEAILTDEQFRKIETMRNDLRKDMKKLREQQHDVMEKHKRDFESILTDEQKKALEQKHNENHNKTPAPGAGKTGARNDAGTATVDPQPDGK
ncbi:MAG: Spy/CpxP family protein refolding chaperone [Alphaproteobacteria bacterium]|nr:Spy/CpxP family protein refolding chaperone [Alphaproteobacteria bacterium]